MKKVLLTMLVLLLGMSVVPAFAGGNYAMTCVRNETGMPIHFQYWWGDGTPNQRVLAANETMRFWYEYPYGSTMSPDLVIRVDADLSDGTSWRLHTLQRYQTVYNNDCRPAKNYRMLNSNNFLLMQALD